MQTQCFIPPGPNNNTFKEGCRFERGCWPLMDNFHGKYFTEKYEIRRITDRRMQSQGFDVLFINKITGERFGVDEKFRSQMFNDVLIEVYSNIEMRTKGWGLNEDPKFLQYVRTDYDSQEASMHFIKMNVINAIAKSAQEQLEPLIPEILANKKINQKYNLWGQPIDIVAQYSNGTAYRGLAVAIPFDAFKDIFNASIDSTYLWDLSRQEWFRDKEFDNKYSFK